MTIQGINIFVLKFQLILKWPIFTNEKIVGYFQRFWQIGYWIDSIPTTSFMSTMYTQDILQFSIVVCLIFLPKSVGINSIYVN